MASKKSAICLTKQMHRVIQLVASKHDTTLSQLVRRALREVPPELMTMETARATGGGYFRTMVNLPYDLDDKLDEYSLFSGMSRSAIIRVALNNYIMMNFTQTALNSREV